MRIIILPRSGGKTTELIKMSAGNQYYIVCHNINEAARIAEQAIELGANIPFPLTYDEFLQKLYYAKGTQGVLIDNVEMLLNHISMVPIGAITLTQEIEDDKDLET